MIPYIAIAAALQQSPALGAPVVHAYRVSRPAAERYFRRAATGTGLPPQSTSCRDLLQQTDWDGDHGMQPYTGTDPLTSIHFEHCALYDANKDYENENALSPEAVHVTGQKVRFRAWLDAAHTIQIADFEVSVFDLDLGRLAYDGVTDYAGPSGAHLVADPLQSSALLVTADFPVTNASFFTGPWRVFSEARLDEGCFFQAEGGAYSYDPHNLAAMATVATFNP